MVVEEDFELPVLELVDFGDTWAAVVVELEKVDVIELDEAVVAVVLDGVVVSTAELDEVVLLIVVVEGVERTVDEVDSLLQRLDRIAPSRIWLKRVPDGILSVELAHRSCKFLCIDSRPF